MFTIKVKNVKTDEFEVKVRATETIAQLKGKIQAHTDIPEEKQILLFKGKELVDADTIAKYPLVDGSIVDLMQKLSE